MAKKPEYVSIAETLRDELLKGLYDEKELPSNSALAERFDVNLKTAGRAVQQLVAEGILIARPGMRAVPAPRDLRTSTQWPMTGRYARARAAQGLVFGGDVTGSIRKETVLREWVEASIQVARLLKVAVGTRVFQRQSRTYVDFMPAEETTMYFPAEVVAAAPSLEQDENIRVVPLIESAGFVVTRTANEIRARLADVTEQAVFDVGAQAVVFEHAHGTYGAQGEALEAVINVRPARNTVITFDTYEGPIPEND
ncbi:GntR family transcriptional regulator [Micromonospora sp. NPDC050695]|uniref:GntR family transcriptional regulator n=1 Tax=Micromonospora sp. NPDC050695 TaxID=3154938 RepID=UPI0033D4BFC4